MFFITFCLNLIKDIKFIIIILDEDHNSYINVNVKRDSRRSFILAP